MEGSKLYVGNLNYSVRNEDLEVLFAEYGKIVSVNVIEGKGFGFVEMASPAEAERAKKALHGKQFKGRALRIDEANAPASHTRSGPPPKLEAPEPPGEEWNGLSPEQTQDRIREMVLEASLKETGFGARRFYFVARDNKIPFIDISDELTSRLERGQAAIVEIPGEEGDYTVVPREVAQKIRSVDPESVRFMNPETPPEPPRRGRPPRRNNF